ncbi:hypothetical protein ABFS82_02G092900 [Erythranthe guttata]|uniref:TRF2/HOY1 PH-like domain-containing protein n=1 Tax=Erythranthe guttata TaxID=4155 RepID=A0A022RAG3_ERYGU|nr:PREDICTED: uncharacterized protein LOC105958161 [Erythranthe guttata]EYU37246.1 hypothetical protein MIMGU_mgv1a005144mg [Erythranthe guttata]|eukprot:XP_012837625.1 PREDICTED: uncharacterized protein LOC105958161 [Erythranthe guttata]
MGESVFGVGEKEDGFEHLENNHSFLQAINVDDHDFESGVGPKRIRLSPHHFNHFQEGETDSSSGGSSPLGLSLKKTPSFLDLLQRSLFMSKAKDTVFTTTSPPENPTTKSDDSAPPSSSISEKLKASNFPAVFINIGSWQRCTRHEGDLTAKLYYAKRKLVWEVLDGALKSKIEIQWSDIIGIRAILPDNEHGTLEIELNNPPLYYREINPQPRKHTLWQQSSDFTGGQAPIWRRHYVKFPAGILDKHYEKLLQCDERLFALSQKPFPTCESAYFDPTMFRISEMYLNFNNRSRMQYPYPPPTVSPMPNPTIPVMDLPYGNEGGSINPFAPDNNNNNNIVYQDPWYINTAAPQGGSQVYDYDYNHQTYYNNNNEYSKVGALGDIENHLFGESQVLYSDEGTLGANMESMCSLLEPAPLMNYDHQMMMNIPDNNIYSDGNFYTSSAEGTVNWLPQEFVINNDATETAEATLNNALPLDPFMFPGNDNPTSRDYFFN